MVEKPATGMSVSTKDVREVGAEWMSYQAIEQLQIASFLEGQGKCS